MTQAKQEKIVVLPLNQVKADFQWNGRYVGGGDSPLWSQSDGSEDGNDWNEFKGSIADRGQDTPVTVRPKGQKFELVCGFRRYLAIQQIAEERGDKNPTINAVVREYDDLEARAANLRENTERDDFRPADLCWTVKQLCDQFAKKKVKVTQAALAADVGKSQSFVAKLLGIAENLDPSILDEWRGLHRDISVNKVYELSKVSPVKDQRKLWEELKKAQASKEKAPMSDEEKAAAKETKAAERFEKALTAAREESYSTGFMLGRLYRDGVITLPKNELDSAAIVETCVDLPDGLKARQLNAITKQVDEGFKAGQSEDEDEEETEEAEEAAE